MTIRLLPFALLAAFPFAMAANTVTCPDLAAAVQVASCPAEEELRYTFTGYCSDNSRSYKGDTDVCTDYQAYRRLKNVALWESADGNFNAYVSCERTLASVRAARVSSIRVGKQGKLTQLVCSYGEGLNFTLRTRAECRVEAAAACTTDPVACKASCD